jgi:hypothetical protein
VASHPLAADTDLAEVVASAHEADRATWWKAAVDEQVDTNRDQLRAQLGELVEQRLRQQGGDA